MDATGVGVLTLMRASRLRLWLALTALVLMVLGLLFFLAGRYEASQWQSRAEHDATEAVQDVRAGLLRNLQNFQATHTVGREPSKWQDEAARLLLQHRELVAIEWRQADLRVTAASYSPFWGAQVAAERQRRETSAASGEIAPTCAAASRQSAGAYSPSYFWSLGDGVGMEVMEVCMPLVFDGKLAGYTVGLYALQAMLSELVAPSLLRGQTLAFTEADGTRLALVGNSPRASLRFVATQLLDLPGNTLVVRVERGRNDPDVFPNVVTAWVSGLSIALLTVLALLLVDMQRRQRAESELAQALAFRKAMEDSLITGLRARDLQGRITYVNPAFCDMVGYSADELTGDTDNVPYWPQERSQEYQRRQSQRFASGELLSGKARSGFESVFIRRQGQAFPVLIIEAPLIDAKGEHSGWMSAVIDLSEKRQAEEIARASEERLQAAARLATVGEMASLLSHELNQPLAAISSYAQGAINVIATNSMNPETKDQKEPEIVTTELISDALKRIAAQADRAGKVIRSVNDFVRRRERQRDASAPDALIDAVLPLVRLHAHQASVQVMVSVSPDLPPVWCDRTLVEQVLLNLARNAIQAMDVAQVSKRVLKISAGKAEGAWVEFQIADTGLGIDTETAARLFTAFFTTKAEGMGLGLSLCRTVVEQHGGALLFEPNHQPGGDASKPASSGTVFKFTLPTERMLGDAA